MQTIGKYEVLDVLGYGGMGVVYRARDNAIGRPVALKVMSAAMAQHPELRERFLREARAAGNLQHPNIVVIYDLGEHEGTPYIAMELLGGQPLDKALAGGSLSAAEKLRILAQVCDGLQFAHENGVVHRDVKPANVILMRDGTAKLVDFGIARTSDAKLTKTGVVVGTVAYMAPEQLKGKTVDARTDVFAAGAMLYEMLAGKLPFDGESTAETMMKILQEEPPELKPEGVISPDALAAIVRRALEKDPAQRYQSARDFGRAVRDYLQMQERGGLAATVVRPRPEPLPERARTTVAPDPEPTRRSALPAPSVSPPTVVAQRPVAPASTPAGPRGEAGFRLSAYSDAGDSESSRSRAVRTSRWLLGMAVLLVVIFLATLAWYNRSAKDSAETLPAHEQTGAPASSPTGEPAQATPTQPPPAPELPYVTGTVLDPMNTPLPDASVKLLDGAGETIDSATTDDKGRFRFKPNMSATRLQFEMAGFRSYRCGLWRKNGSMPAGARRVRTVLSVGNSSEFVELARCPAR